MKRRDFILTGISISAGFFLPGLKAYGRKALPNVLIIGDSISMGYTPYVKELLEGKANVLRPEENCLGTINGVKKIDKWLGINKYAVIHFNFGLHDLKHVDAITGKQSKKAGDPLQADIPAYLENLEAIINKLKATGAKLIFATTTPVPAKVGGPLREPEQPPKYNEAALRLMKKNKIAVNDLYSFAQARITEIQKPNDVHYTEEGYKVMGEEVAATIKKYLKG